MLQNTAKNVFYHHNRDDMNQDNHEYSHTNDLKKLSH